MVTRPYLTKGSISSEGFQQSGLGMVRDTGKKSVHPDLGLKLLHAEL
jgi:hypothetical protein